MKQAILFISTLAVIIACNSDDKQNTSGVSENAQEDMPAKYTDLEYQDLIEACDRVIEDYKNAVEVSDNEHVKRQMRLLGYAWFSFYGKTVEAKFDSSRTDYFNKKDSARQVLRRYQQQMFPKYRTAFAQYASKLLWEQDCEASAEGDSSEILILSGNYFLPNANKKATYEQLKDMAEKFRFKKMRFKWFASDDDFFDYDIRSEDDADYVSMQQ